jgi:hypothetical protein
MEDLIVIIEQIDSNTPSEYMILQHIIEKSLTKFWGKYCKRWPSSKNLLLWNVLIVPITRGWEIMCMGVFLDKQPKNRARESWDTDGKRLGCPSWHKCACDWLCLSCKSSAGYVPRSLQMTEGMEKIVSHRVHEVKKVKWTCGRNFQVCLCYPGNIFLIS